MDNRIYIDTYKLLTMNNKIEQLKLPETKSNPKAKVNKNHINRYSNLIASIYILFIPDKLTNPKKKGNIKLVYQRYTPGSISDNSEIKTMLKLKNNLLTLKSVLNSLTVDNCGIEECQDLQLAGESQLKVPQKVDSSIDDCIQEANNSIGNNEDDKSKAEVIQISEPSEDEENVTDTAERQDITKYYNDKSIAGVLGSINPKTLIKDKSKNFIQDEIDKLDLHINNISNITRQAAGSSTEIKSIDNLIRK